MKILLTNDDGYLSPGVAAARDALVAAGMSVITVAPDGPRSGTARSASFRKPIVLNRVGGDDANPVYSTNGTPTDCVRVAVFAGLTDDVDAVVSGINEGANLGDDATYSSTLGSAIEGAMLGFPSLAASQQSRDGRFRLVDLDGYDFELGAALMARLVKRMVEDRDRLPGRSVLNFNAPAKPARSLVLASLDRRVWQRSTIPVVETEDGRGWLLFATHAERDPVFEGEAGTDVRALSEGHASVTPMNFAWTDRHARRHLLAWARGTIADLNASIMVEGSSVP
ncbi:MULTISPECIES: 5'/3'-nucleotidase SurE [unclassified Mesorhizobium]|uniref:5'/3'-nucleotidase SurE n=1 Tax=unclassified Mesorhizobium TaxID=325217 RepID=UPI000467A663|nr:MULTISPECIES: 5'/3'-nucleotidase SurE [unclassified Mesorhizobium]